MILCGELIKISGQIQAASSLIWAWEHCREEVYCMIMMESEWKTNCGPPSTINAAAKCQMQNVSDGDGFFALSILRKVLEGVGGKKSIICLRAIQSVIRSRGCINKLCSVLM